MLCTIHGPAPLYGTAQSSPPSRKLTFHKDEGNRNPPATLDRL
jgi:hypothetical protein